MADNELKQKMARMKAHMDAQLNEQRSQAEEQSSFKQFSASELYCPKCKQSMPVKEGLLLHLPGGELFDYKCSRCGTSLGTRTA